MGEEKRGVIVIIVNEREALDRIDLEATWLLKERTTLGKICRIIRREKKIGEDLVNRLGIRG